MSYAAGASYDPKMVHGRWDILQGSFSDIKTLIVVESEVFKWHEYRCQFQNTDLLKTRDETPSCKNK